MYSRVTIVAESRAVGDWRATDRMGRIPDLWTRLGSRGTIRRSAWPRDICPRNRLPTVAGVFLRA
jgi:hypothetical protein